MTQAEINFESYPENPFYYGSQNWLLYDRLTQGPVTNSEIVRDMGIFNSTGRISDIRRRLQGVGLEVVGEQIQKGLWSYKLKKVREAA